MGVHRVGFLLEHFQPALYSMLGTNTRALPHIQLDGMGDCQRLQQASQTVSSYLLIP